MSLLRRIENDGDADSGQHKRPKTESDSVSTTQRTNLYFELKQQLLDEAKQELDMPESPTPETRAALYDQVEAIWHRIGQERELVISKRERSHLVQAVVADLAGFGPLQPWLEDDNITQIMVNDPQQIYVTRKGLLTKANVTFDDESHLLRILERILPGFTRQDPLQRPLQETFLADGSRVTVIFSPIARETPVVMIQKMSTHLYTMEDLIKFGTLTPQTAELLRGCVFARLNIAVSGTLGSGKTALISGLASLIPEEERIIVVEREPRLKLLQEHVIMLLTETVSKRSNDEISAQDVIRYAQRMSPDRLIIEDGPMTAALEIIQAMYNGEDGTIFSLYATSPRDAVERLEVLSMMHGGNHPVQAVRKQIASTVDLIVQVGRLRDGTRKITHLTEVQGIEDDILVLSDIYVFEQIGQEAGKIIGKLKPTGLRPRFMDRMADVGIHLSPSVFGIGSPPSQPSEPIKETPTPELAEDVYFTMFHPKEAAAEDWYTMLVYLHIESALDTIRSDAQKFIDEMADDPRMVHGRHPAQLVRGTEVKIVLEAEGVEFKPKSISLSWDEDSERAHFRFRASKELAGQPCFGEMTAYVGPLQIANQRFSIFISDPDDTAQADTSDDIVTESAKMYQRIFASYSHQDTSIVQACVKAFKAIGYGVSIDYDTLRSGEVWSEALEKMIEESDIFQLFWSTNAADSKYVEREWKYALSHKKTPGFIRPVYWEVPAPEIPSELDQFHFKYLPELKAQT